MPLSKKHRILFAEDVSTDREMVERLLRQNGIDFVSECVDTEPEFREQLNGFNPTLILSDYRMPTFDGMKALQIARQEKPDVPFIILTGSMNEDVAVECMKNGADDYVIKQNLRRLIPSIKSALEKKTSEQNWQYAQKELEDSENKYQILVENMPSAIFLLSNHHLVFINKRFTEILGYTIDELNQNNLDIDSLIHPDHQAIFREQLLTDQSEKVPLPFEIDMISKTGKIINTELSIASITFNGKRIKQGIIRDVSYRKELMSRNLMLSRAIEQSPVSIVITDSNASIEYVNPFFEKRTGYSYDEAIGQNPRILQSGEHDAQFYKNMWNCLVGGKMWSGEIKNKKKDGTFYWENVRISPVYNSAGALKHYVSVKEDVTERKKTLEELQAAKEKAEESNRLKSAFLATMSHELRTPLNAIIGFSDIISEIAADEQIAEFNNIIRDSGYRLLEMIEDIFNLAMLERAEVHIRKNQIFIRELFIDLRNELQEALNNSNKKDLIKLDFHIDPEIRYQQIITDKPKVFQAVSNILKNAVKYTHTGFINLKVDLLEENLLSISVEDSGIGIAKENIDFIFDFFRQGDDSHTREYGGVGIGLALVKRIVDALNGKILVKTEEHKGSEFTIQIPVTLA